MNDRQGRWLDARKKSAIYHSREAAEADRAAWEAMTHDEQGEAVRLWYMAKWRRFYGRRAALDGGLE